VGHGFFPEVAAATEGQPRHVACKISAASAAEVSPFRLLTDAGNIHREASSPSAISSNFLTVFQFLPVHDVFSVLSTSVIDSFGRAIPFGK
jgi:hypothetical protein